MMLLGVSVNAAVIPLHTWLADAYPKATITGAVFMSAFTTKSAFYVLLRVFPGWELLTWFGAAMAIYGVIYAVICKDIREILAYHIRSEEHTSELQSRGHLVCRLLLEKKNRHVKLPSSLQRS